MRIGIIEDDRSVASQLVYALTIEGGACHLFKDAETVLRALPRESFDACIIDLMLPGMDGKSLLRTLRERKQWVPALVLTVREVSTRCCGCCRARCAISGASCLVCSHSICLEAPSRRPRA